jgi:hypothetical protein
MELPAMVLPAKKARKDLTADSLFGRLHDNFDRIPDRRSGQPKVSLGDALMSGFAMFSLKDPSLLAFDERRDDPSDNFRTIYGIDAVPSDTQMRTILDSVDPDSLRPCFTDIFRCLQRGKVLEDYVYLGGYLVSLDGTTYYNSDNICCSSCLVKRHRNQVVSYYHQLLGATIVHPDLKEVIPLTPEPIIKQDGCEKNDCERNATRRWLQRFRKDHPHLSIIVVEDALSSNAPHLRDLANAGAHYIIGVKPGDHPFLFQKLREADDAGQTRHFTQVDVKTNVLRHYRWHLQVPLNESNADCLVDVLEYWEIKPDGDIQYFSWITDLALTEQTVYDVMRGGRARWKIENECFNTLKNQGYHLEHNYGHGQENLSVVLVMLMMLAFLVDQVQQRCCPVFQAARAKFRTNRYFWERVRSLFQEYVFVSMAELLTALAQGMVRQKPILADST